MRSFVAGLELLIPGLQRALEEVHQHLGRGARSERPEGVITESRTASGQSREELPARIAKSGRGSTVSPTAFTKRRTDVRQPQPIRFWRRPLAYHTDVQAQQNGLIHGRA